MPSSRRVAALVLLLVVLACVGMCGAIIDNHTVTLLEFNSTGIIFDASQSPLIWTNNNGTAIDSTLVRAGFGNGQAKFNGSAYNWITTPNTPQLNLTGDYSVDFLINFSHFTTTGNSQIISSGAHVGGGKFWEIIYTGGLIGLNCYNTTGYVYQLSSAMTTNTTHYVVFGRQGNTVYMAIDGAIAGTNQTYTGSFFPSSAWIVGKETGATYRDGANMYFDEFRVSNVSRPITVPGNEYSFIPLSASFTSDKTQVRKGSSIQFTDTSSGAISWSWIFGDGGTSVLQNPSHTFASNGIFPVQLNISNSSDIHSTANTTIFVNKTFVVIGDSTARGPNNGREDCNGLAGCTGNGVVWNASYISQNGSYTGELQNNWTANLPYWGNYLNNGSGYNMGMAGQRVYSTITARWPRDALGYNYAVADNITTVYGITQSIPQTPDVLVVGGGINDITDGKTSAEVEAAILPLIQNATENNIEVIVINIFPNIIYSTAINEINTWEKTTLPKTSFPRVRVFNAYAFLNDGAGNIKSPYSVGDGAHITETAYIDMTRAIYLENIDLFMGTSILSQFTPSGPQSTRWPWGIAFRDTSTGSPTAWNWNWGDGTHCYTQNCYKAWYGPGTYRVNLTVNSSLSDYSSNTTTVNVMRPWWGF